MSTARRHRIGHAAWPVLAVLMAWSAYTTLGLVYTVLALALLLAGVDLGRQRRWPLIPLQPGFWPLVLLCLWLTLSSLWSAAPARVMAPHLWSYALLLLVPMVALVCPPDAARAGLRHFVWASACAALLVLGTRLGWLPVQLPWQRVVDAGGNQRIATSLWLALGAVFALNQMLQTGRQHVVQRLMSLAAALLCLLAVALQDRRSGMVLLLPLLASWAVLYQRTAWRRILVLATLTAAAISAWQLADGVRARFAEGLHELHAARTPETVNTSWGQRLYMLEITGSLVAQRPLIGHGLGSWPGLWAQKTPSGSELQKHSTPHNEYLLAAVQGGTPAVLLLLLALAARLRACWQAGLPGLPGLQLWLTVALGGLFNAILRDAKFELTLLLLAALATAVTRQDRLVSTKPSAAAPGREAPSSRPL